MALPLRPQALAVTRPATDTLVSTPVLLVTTMRSLPPMLLLSDVPSALSVVLPVTPRVPPRLVA